MPPADSNATWSHLLSERAVLHVADSAPPLLKSVARRGPPCVVLQLGCCSPAHSVSEPTSGVEGLCKIAGRFPFWMGLAKLRAICLGPLSRVAMKKTPQASSKISKKARTCKQTTRRGQGGFDQGRGSEQGCFVVPRRVLSFGNFFRFEVDKVCNKRVMGFQN